MINFQFSIPVLRSLGVGGFHFLLIILFTWLSWRDIKLAAKVLAGLLPIYLLRLDIFGIPATMLEILIWVLLVVWVVSGLKEHRWKLVGFKNSIAKQIPTAPLRLPISMLLLAGIVAVLVAPDTFAALGVFKAYIIEPLLFFVLVTTTFNRKDVEDLFVALSFTTIFLGAVAIFQLLTGIGIPEPWDTARRATSIFPFPNAVGLFVGPMLAALPWLFFHDLKHSKSRVWLWIITFVLGVTAVIASQTEAVWIAVPIAIGIIGLMRPIPNLRKWVLGVAAIVVFTIAISPWRGTVIQKLTLQDHSGQVRISQWSETVDYLSDGNWVFGAGLSGYPAKFEPYHKTEQYEIFQYPHNIVLNIWVELGIIGLIGLIGLMLVITRIAYKNKSDVLSLAAFAALLQMFIHGLVDVPFFKNDLAVLTWIFVAIILIVNHLPSKSSSQHEHQFEVPLP